jgi:hypothetical protein
VAATLPSAQYGRLQRELLAERARLQYDRPMLKFELREGELFAVARIEGLVSVEAWAAVLEALAAALQAGAAPPRLVMDLTALLGYLGTPERRTVGAMMASHLAGMQKVALVIQAHKITGIVQDEAQRHGLNLRLFPGGDDARAWVSA